MVEALAVPKEEGGEINNQKIDLRVTSLNTRKEHERFVLKTITVAGG